MDEQNRESLAADTLRSMKLFIKSNLHDTISARTIDAGTDAGKQRVLASEIAVYQLLTNAKEWEVGMTTEPGDVVWDPDHNYQYIYTGEGTYQHTNELFYPGAAGVYFWAVIPKLKNFIKVYPGIEGIGVAVKQGETWWNTDGTQMYSWKGIDNDNCIWPPMEGNEWEVVTND